MAEQRVQRRLAAILAADVAGYSRLVGDDEEETLAALTAHRRELIDPKIRDFGGRIVNTAGDSVLAEFSSVVEALRCAIDIQRGMSDRNAGVPEGRQIRFRIGLNLGDVIDQEGDLLGDGVNVAARLESLAEPGGICMSRAARDQVRDRMDIALKDRGEVRVKNIARPVRVFTVSMDGADAPTSRPSPWRGYWPVLAVSVAVAIIVVAGLWRWGPWTSPDGTGGAGAVAERPAAKPSIAVLPFANISGDKEQDYFSDGLTQDLITDLSKISALTVIARDSTFKYRDKTPDLRAVADALGVRYVLQGNVRKAGDQLRINTQLIDVTSGANIWAERYDRKLSSIFELQDEVLGRIVTALSIKLVTPSRRKSSARGTNSVEAYDLYLKANYQESQFTRAGNAKALEFLERAVAIDPGYAMAYARMANLHELNARAGWTNDADVSIGTAIALAQQAIRLDEHNPYAHWTLGRVQKGTSVENLEVGIRSIKRAIELQPSYSDAYAYLTYLYVGAGRLGDARKSIETAMRLNPLYPYWYFHARAVVHYMSEDYGSAVTDLKKAAERNPAVHFVQFWLAAAYAMAGRTDDAQWQVEEMKGMGIKSTIGRILSTSRIHHPPFRDRYLAGLRKAGVPE